MIVCFHKSGGDLENIHKEDLLVQGENMLKRWLEVG